MIYLFLRDSQNILLHFHEFVHFNRPVKFVLGVDVIDLDISVDCVTLHVL